MVCNKPLTSDILFMCRRTNIKTRREISSNDSTDLFTEAVSNVGSVLVSKSTDDLNNDFLISLVMRGTGSSRRKSLNALARRETSLQLSNGL